MPRFLKIFIGIITFLGAAFLILSFFSMRLMKKSLPQTTGEITLPILQQEVTITRDAFGVPHITAQTEDDLWRAAGFAAAQDRLWQMEFTRRVVRGTLAEIFGPTVLEQDKFLRTWGFYRTAKQVAPKLAPQSRAMLSAYAEGVNAFISANSDKLPLEFSMLGFKPEPWEIEDSIGLSRLMAFRLCHAWFFEAALGKVAEQFGAPMALEIFPAVLPQSPTILAHTVSSSAAQLESFIQLAQTTRTQIGMPPGVLGSNNWVVHGSRTRSGKPLLANDPHLGLGLPSVWYEMHLKAGDFEVLGQTLPGAPGVVLGHNRHIAWGFTNGMVDDLDFYHERLNGNEYLSSSGWKPLTTITERLAVKGADPQEFTIRFTEHGPLVNDILDIARNDTLGLAVQWTGFKPSDELAAFHGLNRARSWTEFENAMRLYTVPSQNVVYADVAGNIGYRLCGKVPIRRDGLGYLPYRGWESAGDWVGDIPFEEMPSAFNPSQGFVATANNLISSASRHYISNSWEPSSRIERITEMLQSNAQADTAFFKKMQLDQFSKHAQYTLPRLLALLQADTSATPSDTSIAPSDTALTLVEKQALGLLRQWDYVESTESVAATLYNVWALEFIQAALKDEMGDTLFQNYVQWSSLVIRALEHLAAHPNSPWFDDRNTENVENGRDIARRALRTSMQRLQEKFGELMGDWQWGQLHQLTLEHVMGKQKPLDVIFNLGPMPLGGSPNTVNKGEYNFSKPYAVNSGASMRTIVDLSQPEVSLSVIPGGQSGQPFSPHYKDQVALWLKGEYRRVSMAPMIAREDSKEVLRLKPQ